MIKMDRTHQLTFGVCLLSACRLAENTIIIHSIINDLRETTIRSSVSSFGYENNKCCTSKVLHCQLREILLLSHSSHY